MTEKKKTNLVVNERKMFEKHELKILNLALLLYVCFGALLFDYVGDFQDSRTKGKEDRNVEAITSLPELRLNSARRMWNITNRLNILYETNWTQLVLDELVEFERVLLESLLENKMQFEEDRGEEEKKRKKESSGAKRNNNKSRLRSIKKSLIHSIATITTIASPNEQPRGRAAKLATVIYGAIGIPFLFVVVSRSGRQAAKSSLNSILIIRHYCFSLPVHYLCCSCNLLMCFKYLSWLCCCCCCSYLCCPTSKKTICCDKRRAPKLRLRTSKIRRRKKAKGLSASAIYREATQTAFAIAANQVSNVNNQQKSVRFINQQQNKPISDGRSSDEETTNDEEQEEQQTSLYSSGLFVTSLSLLGLYVSFGAYFYSRAYNVSLIDAFFECYSTLSTTKLPESFKVDDLKLNALETLKLNKGKQKPVQTSLYSDTFEAFAWDSIYLICGLNLISMCAHFANLWFSGSISDELSQCPVETSEACNGHIANSLIGNSLLNVMPFNDLSSQEDGAIKTDHHYMVQSVIESQSGNQVAPVQPQQVNLAELYVVSPQDSPAELQYNPIQQTSDVSFASDRSTDRNSLCAHHQQAQQIPSQTISTLYNPSTLVYKRQLMNQMPAMGHHMPQKHLYLPNASLIDENEDDNDDMERILKSCIEGGKMRSSSSLLHLSHHPNQLIGSNGFNQVTEGSGNRIANNGFEQDSSVNTTMDTNSNTMSSSSSRTIKPPQMHRHLPNGIGFILNESKQEL